jgi:sarcosine oxidase
VPLVQQAYQLWYQLEEESNKKLLLRTGGLMLGTPGSTVVKGAMLSALKHHLPYEYLDSGEIKKRFPGFNPATGTVGVYEKNAGILFPEECIRTNLELAQRSNTSFHFNEIVTCITGRADSVEITTTKDSYIAAKVIISAGAWLNELLPDLQLPLTVARQPLFWFTCEQKDAKKYLPATFPVYIWQCKKNKIFYGFPDLGDGIKIAIHHGGKKTSPFTIDRQVPEGEINEMGMLITDYLGVKASYNYSVVCMYTNTPDEDFIIDYHPSNRNIIIASPCSGHGFKFSSAIGKLLCDMFMEKPLSFNISVFNIARLIK